MRLWLAFLASAVLLAAQRAPAPQPKVQFRAEPAAPRGERARPGPQPRRAFGAPWWAWPGWWSSSLDYKPLPPPVDPPKESPALVWNPHWEAQKPVAPVRAYETEDAATIPAPTAAAEAPGEPCQLREASGREFDALECRFAGDVVRWKSADGRWHRATTDLVDVVRPRR
jgi:hypothetical protein